MSDGHWAMERRLLWVQAKLRRDENFPEMDGADTIMHKPYRLYCF